MLTIDHSLRHSILCHMLVHCLVFIGHPVCSPSLAPLITLKSVILWQGKIEDSLKIVAACSVSFSEQESAQLRVSPGNDLVGVDRNG